MPNTSQLLTICSFLDINIYQLIGIEDPYKLTDEELLILNELRKDSNNKEIVKRVLIIK